MQEGIFIEEPAKTDPEAVIALVRQEVALLGRNDSEFPRLDDISNKLRAGVLSPEDAIRQAREVLSGKQEH